MGFCSEEVHRCQPAMTLWWVHCHVYSFPIVFRKEVAGLFHLISIKKLFHFLNMCHI